MRLNDSFRRFLCKEWNLRLCTLANPLDVLAVLEDDEQGKNRKERRNDPVVRQDTNRDGNNDSDTCCHD